MNRPSRHQAGTTLLEVLVTVVIVAFGLLGIAAFQAKAQVGSIESYQRAQAVILLQDMSERLVGNSDSAASYVTSTPIGTGDSQPDSCSDTAAGAPHDLCEWSHALKGAGEADSGGAKVGAMVGARGCVEMVQTPDTTAGVCQPAIYQVSVAWQGMHETQAPTLTCGQGLYGAEGLRRSIALRVTVPLRTCI